MKYELIFLGCFIAFSIPSVLAVGINGTVIVGANHGPQVPLGSSTITQFCSSGTCVTPGSNSGVIGDSNTTGNTFNFNNEANASSIGITLSSAHRLGIQLSESCITMFKAGFNDGCLNYLQIMKLHRDNTNGSFIEQWTNSSGYYHRVQTKIPYSVIYNPSSWEIMVDPDTDFTARSKMIIVEPKDFTWVNPDDNATNTYWLQHNSRYIQAPCDGGLVASNLKLLNDTISYIMNGCTITSFNDTQQNFRPDIPFSFDNPFASWHYSNYTSVNATGGLGLRDCIHFECKYKDPYANW